MAAVQAWYQILLVLSMLVCAGTTGYVWPHRDCRGALPLSFVFALAYTGKDGYVTRRVVTAIAAEPIVFTALVWTNRIHELVWTATLDSTVSGGIEVSAQPLFWAHTLYSYGLLAAASSSSSSSRSGRSTSISDRPRHWSSRRSRPGSPTSRR